MSLVFRSAARYGLIPDEFNPVRRARCKTSSGYKPTTITPAQAFALYSELQQPESTIVLLVAATGLCASECLGLQWQDVDFSQELIRVQRSWVNGRTGELKTKNCKASVPLHPLLASHLQKWRDQSIYSAYTDWCFPSIRMKGKKPRVGNMIIEDHIRPAAVRAGIIKPGDRKRFGLHTLRHSLASFLVQQGKNPTVVQQLLRHSDVHTTLGIYSHSRNEDRMAAQGALLMAFFKQPGATVQ